MRPPCAGSPARSGRPSPATPRADRRAPARPARPSGPDASGVFAGAGAIGQNRLAIIDLVTGDPPIANEDGTIGVALNGEIYNYAQLREELRGAGHRLRHAGRHRGHRPPRRGPRPVDARPAPRRDVRLRGLGRRPRAARARPRPPRQEAPLLLAPRAARFVFGSEIKAVLAAPGRAAPSSTPSAIPALPRLRLRADAAHVLRGHPRACRPGTCSSASRDGEPSLERYWEPPVPGVDGAPAARPRRSTRPPPRSARRLRDGRRTAASSPTCRSARSSAAASTPAASSALMAQR